MTEENNYAPVHLQLNGFLPHFMIHFPDGDQRYATDALKVQFLDRLDSHLKRMFGDAMTAIDTEESKKDNMQSRKLARQLFGLEKPKVNKWQQQQQQQQAGQKRPHEQSLFEKWGGADVFDPNQHNWDENSDNDDGAIDNPFAAPSAQVLEGMDEDLPMSAAEFNQRNLDAMQDMDPPPDKEKLDNVCYLRDYIQSSRFRLVSKVEKTARLPLHYYQPRPDEMWDISVVHPKLVKELRIIIGQLDPRIEVYDAALDFTIRYLADMQYKPCTWFRLTKGGYRQLVRSICLSVPDRQTDRPHSFSLKTRKRATGTSMHGTTSRSSLYQTTRVSNRLQA